MLFSDLAVAIRGFVGGGTWNEILAFNYDSFITFFFFVPGIYPLLFIKYKK